MRRNLYYPSADRYDCFDFSGSNEDEEFDPVRNSRYLSALLNDMGRGYDSQGNNDN